MKFEMESPNNHGGEKCNPSTVERLGIRTKKPNRLSWAINKNHMPFHSFIIAWNLQRQCLSTRVFQWNGSVLQSEEFVSEYAVES